MLDLQLVWQLPKNSVLSRKFLVEDRYQKITPSAFHKNRDSPENSMIHRPIRYYYYRMLRQHSSPGQLAAGIAVGGFIGLAIPYGLQIIAIVLAALLFRNFNRIAALFGSMVSNPLTIPFVYIVYYRIGSRITGLRLSEEIADSPDSQAVWTMLNNFEVYRETLMAMGIAALLVATVSAVSVYFITKPLIAKYQQHRKKRLQAAFKAFVERAKSFAPQRREAGDVSSSGKEKDKNNFPSG